MRAVRLWRGGCWLTTRQCSNFVCCGLALADLHELVSHFEETHVTVLSPDGAPLSPDSDSLASPQTASSSALESPRSTCATPPPPPNLFPTLTAAFQPRESAFEPVTTSPSREACAWVAPLHLAKEEQYVFDTMLRSEAYDCNAAGGLQAALGADALRLPPAQMHYPSSVVPGQTTGHGSGHGLPPTLAPTPVYARPPMLSILTEGQGSAQGKKRNADGNSCVSAADAISPRRRKGALHKPPIREKTHKCPVSRLPRPRHGGAYAELY